MPEQPEVARAVDPGASNSSRQPEEELAQQEDVEGAAEKVRRPTAGSQVLARPTRSQIRYTGIIVIAPGSIIVARTRPKSRLRNEVEVCEPEGH